MMPISAVLQSPYGQHPRQRYDLFIPQSRTPPVLVVCIHGRDWTAGSAEDMRPLALVLAEKGFASACVGYRLLSDGVSHGTALCDDVRTGIEHAVEEAAVLGASARSVIVLGSGSGSLIALIAAWQLAQRRTLSVRGVIACGVLPTLTPWERCSPAVAKLYDQFAGNDRHLLNPMTVDAQGFPPALLIHGDSDPEVPVALVTQLHARLTEAGDQSNLAILSGLGHNALENPTDKSGRMALERIFPFLTEHAREAADESFFCGNQA